MTAYLYDQIPLGVPGHPAELGGQLLELRPAVGVDHPAWRGRRGQRDALGGSDLAETLRAESPEPAPSSIGLNPSLTHKTRTEKARFRRLLKGSSASSWGRGEHGGLPRRRQIASLRSTLFRATSNRRRDARRADATWALCPLVRGLKLAAPRRIKRAAI